MEEMYDETIVVQQWSNIGSIYCVCWLFIVRFLDHVVIDVEVIHRETLIKLHIRTTALQSKNTVTAHL